jgi:hypothetical protein
MGALLDFFTGGTARIQALLVAALTMAATILALTSWALWERSRVFEARAETERVRVQLVAAIDQARVLAEGLRACNAGVEATRATAAAVVAQTGAALEQLKPLLQAHGGQVKRLEDLIKKPPSPGAGCHDAWQAIEAQRKAGAVP